MLSEGCAREWLSSPYVTVFGSFIISIAQKLQMLLKRDNMYNRFYSNDVCQIIEKNGKTRFLWKSRCVCQVQELFAPFYIQCKCHNAAISDCVMFSGTVCKGIYNTINWNINVWMLPFNCWNVVETFIDTASDCVRDNMWECRASTGRARAWLMEVLM